MVREETQLRQCDKYDGVTGGYVCTAEKIFLRNEDAPNHNGAIKSSTNSSQMISNKISPTTAKKACHTVTHVTRAFLINPNESLDFILSHVSNPVRIISTYREPEKHKTTVNCTINNSQLRQLTPAKCISRTANDDLLDAFRLARLNYKIPRDNCIVRGQVMKCRIVAFSPTAVKTSSCFFIRIINHVYREILSIVKIDALIITNSNQ